MISNIRHLSFQNWFGSGYDVPPVIDFSKLAKLQHLNLENFDARNFPALPPAIQTLNISTWYSCMFASDISQAYMHEAKLKALTNLSMGWSSDVLLTDLFRLLEPNKGNLTSLNIGHCTRLTCEDIIELILGDYLVNVVELNMSGLKINDPVVQLLANQLLNLRSLDLGSTKITGVGVKSLVLKNGCKLERLGLNHCYAVSMDAVELAWARGIDVPFTFAEHAPGKSKRLRLF